MTRRDFELIADVFKRTRPTAPKSREVWARTVSAMAYSLASTNPRFDHERFVKACGVDGQDVGAFQGQQMREVMSAGTGHYTGPGGIWLEIDPADANTPAMVYGRQGGSSYSATYDCATGTGTLTNGDEDMELSDMQVAWLDGFLSEVEEAFNAARPEWND